jgi:hypothetical protein
LKLDHLLVAVDDLDAAAERFADRYGLSSIAGGVHEGVGTANRLIPLGERYIELIAVVDPTSDSPIAQLVAATAVGGDALFGVSLAVDDIDAVAARIGSGVVQMSRGDVRFAVTGMEVALGPERLPFFIEWAGAEGHPAGSQGRLDWVEVGGDDARAAAWIGGEVDGVRLVGGKPGVHQACVTRADGVEVLLG